MKKLLATAFAMTVVAFASLISGGRTASASWDWCYEDPIVVIEGRVLDIQVGVPLANVWDVSSADVIIYVPSNVRADIVFVESFPFREKVQVVRTADVWKAGTTIPVRVDVRVNSRSFFDTSMLVSHLVGSSHIIDISQIRGSSNSWMTGRFQLAPLSSPVPN